MNKIPTFMPLISPIATSIKILSFNSNSESIVFSIKTSILRFLSVLVHSIKSPSSRTFCFSINSRTLPQKANAQVEDE
ncbi:MAG: hypothetical protein ACFFA6_15925 [Promethearchaeota archaeon]